MTPLAVRFRAAFLCGLFLLGAVGISLADAALFHEAGHDPYAGVTHLESRGTTHHADRCALAVPHAPSQSAPRIDRAIIALGEPRANRALCPTDASPSTGPTSPHRSRAPPHTV